MSETPSSPEGPIAIENADALRVLLNDHGIVTDDWGRGATKTVEDLWDEVSAGETVIVEVTGELVRRTHVVAVNVTTRLDDGSSYRLYEERQVFKNGASRQRNLLTSLGEKIKLHENIETAVRRSITEELGVTSLKHIEPLGSQTVVQRSSSYQGMPTELQLEFANVEIAAADFNPEGYVERQSDKTVIFKWELQEADDSALNADAV